MESLITKEELGVLLGMVPQNPSKALWELGLLVKAQLRACDVLEEWGKDYIEKHDHIVKELSSVDQKSKRLKLEKWLAKNGLLLMDTTQRMNILSDSMEATVQIIEALQAEYIARFENNFEAVNQRTGVQEEQVVEDLRESFTCLFATGDTSLEKNELPGKAEEETMMDQVGEEGETDLFQFGDLAVEGHQEGAC